MSKINLAGSAAARAIAEGRLLTDHNILTGERLDEPATTSTWEVIEEVNKRIFYPVTIDGKEEKRPMRLIKVVVRITSTARDGTARSFTLTKTNRSNTYKDSRETRHNGMISQQDCAEDLVRIFGGRTANAILERLQFLSPAQQERSATKDAAARSKVKLGDAFTKALLRMAANG